MKKIAINGFGRIGRALFRLGFGREDMEIVALNDIALTSKQAAYLLRYDSVHRRYDKEVRAVDEGIEVNGELVPLLTVRQPSRLPWKDLGVDIVVESTGVFRAKDGEKGASHHLTAGATKVLLSVPPKGEGADKIPQIVYGVNNDAYDAQRDDVVSAASCTTNSLAPVAYVLEKEFGINRAYLSTVHGYTADQRIVDSAHSRLERGRAAAVNIIPTSTGAATATAIVIPSLRGKMDGVAFRVPVPDGSVSDFVAELATDVTPEIINDAFGRYAEGELAGVLGVSRDPIVSSDVLGDSRATVVDLGSTGVVDGRLAKIVTFYDNEWGYTNQLLRIATRLL